MTFRSQPVYPTPLESWRRYEKFLVPLKKGLGDLVAGEG